MSGFAVAGCGEGDNAQPQATADPPIGIFTSTSAVQEDGRAFSSPVIVQIAKSAVGFVAQCNGVRYTDVTITDGQLLVEGGGGTTLMKCPKAAAEQDRDLKAFFMSSPDWRLESKSRLILSNDSVEVALQKDATPTAIPAP